MKPNIWSNEDIKIDSPTISSLVYEKSPEFLTDFSLLFNDERERDVAFLGAVGVISSCFPMITGVYDRRKLAANLFLFLTAPPSAGKGVLSFARMLGEEIHHSLSEEYEADMKEYNTKLKEKNEDEVDFDSAKPLKPVRKKLFIPSNSSSASMLASLQANHDFGILFESEADTLISVLKKEWGNFSDLLRRAFHHEPIESQRKKDDEYISISYPHLSVILSGTPNQLNDLIVGSENGFFSRFIFYCLPSRNEWRNVFDKKLSETDVKVKKLAKELNDFYYVLRDKARNWKEWGMGETIEFTLSDNSQFVFNHWFKEKQSQLFEIYGSDILASIRRLGVIAFRVSMVLTAVRLMRSNDEIKQELVCTSDDFVTALRIVDGLIYHSIAVYHYLSQHQPDKKLKHKKRMFLENLPEKFDRKEGDKVAISIDLNLKTAEKYLSDFVKDGYLLHTHNSYQKKDS